SGISAASQYFSVMPSQPPVEVTTVGSVFFFQSAYLSSTRLCPSMPIAPSCTMALLAGMAGLPTWATRPPGCSTTGVVGVSTAPAGAVQIVASLGMPGMLGTTLFQPVSANQANCAPEGRNSSTSG